jgi:hypothetical protein
MKTDDYIEEGENMKTCTPGLIIFLLIIMWEPGWSYGKVPRMERDALNTLYNKTGGWNWFHKENWKKAPGTENTWYGITCDKGNTTVLKIELRGNNLQGVLPPDMDAFSNLTTLDLSHNQLRGEIPPWIKKLKNIKKLDLSSNRFDGPIPSWIGNLKNLEELFLDNNRLEGPIPEELVNLRNLKVLRLGSNRLTGEIPAELVKLVNLEENQSNFKWNGLYTQNVNLKNFLQKKQINGDWESTQTTAPLDIEVVRVTEDTITIEWQPISYTADNGGYQVFYWEEGQPYDDISVEAVTDKTVAEVSLKGLNKSSKYYFKIYSWTESHRMNTNKIESLFSKEFPAVTGGIIISGTIRNQKDGKGFPGVQLTASNGGGTTYTDKDGKYKLSVIPGWTGTVTPFKEGFKFSLPSCNYDKEVTEDIRGKDYTAESDTMISGIVTYKGKGVGDVKLKFTGENGDNYIALTDEDGNYEKEISYNWSGSITPIKDRHRFNPEKKKYENVTSSREGQNYEVQFPKISGRVKRRSGKGIRGIKLRFKNMEQDLFKYLKDYTVTDEKGNYEIDVLENWIGSVTPESSQRTKHLFFPPSIEINIENLEEVKKDFEAWRDFKFFLCITGYIIHLSDDSEKIISPEITVGFKFSRNFYIYSGLGFIFKHKISDDMKESSLIRQIFSLGIGGSEFSFESKSSFFELGGNFGVVQFKYKRGTLDDKVPSKRWGVKIGLYFILNISDRLFVEIPGLILFAEPLGTQIGLRLGYRF